MFARKVSIMDDLTTSSPCPPWFMAVCDRHECNCTCGKFVSGITSCSSSPEQLSINYCYCMTVDLKTNSSIAMLGSCPYSCIYGSTWYSNPEKLNNKTCDLRWNRHGRLCSQCQDGYGPVVYSYSLQCVPCTIWKIKEVLMFLLISFLPLTIFCFVIIFYRISAARPPLGTFILVSQIMAAPQYLQFKFAPYYRPQDSMYNVTYNTHRNCWSVYATFFGIWNLDFFRSLYPALCLSSHMTTLQAAFLEYCIGLYPLALLALTYVLVKVYDRTCGAGLCNWRPCHSCFAYLRRNVDIRSSLIDAFATFLILSYIKIGYTTLLILQPTVVDKVDGTYKLYVYVDPSYEYFGIDHLLYALSAICISLGINILPLLLLFIYPFSCFQKCLNCCHVRCMVLRTFADAFQGCYKDGTNSMRDLRWFSVAHLMMRFGTVITFDVSRYFVGSLPSLVLLCFFYVTLIALFQPYKEKQYYKIDIFLFLGLSMWTISLYSTETSTMAEDALHIGLMIGSCLVQFVYLLWVILYWIFVVKALHRSIIGCAKICIEKHYSHRILFESV